MHEERRHCPALSHRLDQKRLELLLILNQTTPSNYPVIEPRSFFGVKTTRLIARAEKLGLKRHA
jgi:hypothetical protein